MTIVRHLDNTESVHCDLAIMAVQDRELTAILRLVEDVSQNLSADGHVFYKFTVRTPNWHHRTRLTGVVWPLHDVGRVAGAIAAKRLLVTANSSVLFLVGVAGGFAKNDIQLGDVVVATSIVDYEMQRLSPQGVEFRLRAFDTAGPLLVAAEKAAGDMCVGQPADPPNVRFGIVLSGDKVIASDEAAASLLKAEPTAVAVEMEGAGVAAAVQSTPVRDGFMMIRGIVDLANETKREQAVAWIDVACDAVAAFTLATAFRATMQGS